ncbi:MAG: glycosyltransferase family 2 protein [Bacteroidota bacterium]|nr:glycosyltransferase family 2 protein [Bacteroidota bacterium]
MVPYVSLVIPAYNEAERIGRTLEQVLAYLQHQPYAYEVIVVDDGSQDATAEVVARYVPAVTLLRFQQNRGKGVAVREGMLWARGRYRVFTDADLSTPIEELEPMLGCLESGADMCIGSRELDPSRLLRPQPAYRRWMGRLFRRLVQWLVFRDLPQLREVEDSQCGFKGFRADVAERLFRRARISGFGFDVEILYLAARAGYRISQFPVHWRNDPHSHVHLLRDPLRMLIEVACIRRIHRDHSSL